jgi:hypothetical protein
MNRTIFVLLSLLASGAGFSNNKINYQDPRPDANYVSINNNIVIGLEKPVTLSRTDILNCINVAGSKSLSHPGNVIITKDNRKIIFKPDVQFKYAEEVTVDLTGKLLKSISNSEKFEYRFFTRQPKVSVNPEMRIEAQSLPGQNTMPAPPPQLTVTVNNNPADGYLFLNPFSNVSYLIITDKNGNLFWYSQPTWWSGDFKKQPNGNMTYWDGNLYKHIELDPNYNAIDTFACGNGYLADIHELRLLNGHAFLMAYDTETVDMSHIVQGGDSAASVIGLIIQELDENKNVVFQWRSWDHFEITDAPHENLIDHFIDYVHGNAIEIDNDGNLLISSRHLDEITKINRATGEIIWRLGGLHNQFTFINDTLRFTYQHAVRRISNGNITIFDNGNWHTPQFSRAVEYSLDEINKTATLVWEYRHNPRVFGPYMGYVQRLYNGNTLVSWGGANKTVTEVTPAGAVVFEASYPSSVYTYRAYKFDLNSPVAIHEGNKNIPEFYKLQQNYPNPFNPLTIIKYDIPKASYAEMTVFDITGKELRKLVSAYLKPGTYSAAFDGTNYSSGIYVCILRAGDFNASQKMILLK